MVGPPACPCQIFPTSHPLSAPLSQGANGPQIPGDSPGQRARFGTRPCRVVGARGCGPVREHGLWVRLPEFDAASGGFEFFLGLLGSAVQRLLRLDKHAQGKGGE